MRTLIPIATVAALLLAGCHADHGPAAGEPPAAQGEVPAVNHIATPPAADVGMRYACDPDTLVDVLKGDGDARVTLPDGRQIELGKVAGSEPPVFRGANLYFTLGDHQAHLSQESGRELACRPQ